MHRGINGTISTTTTATTTRPEARTLNIASLGKKVPDYVRSPNPNCPKVARVLGPPAPPVRLHFVLINLLIRLRHLLHHQHLKLYVITCQQQQQQQ